jgi:hypothetical protein
MQVMTKLNFDQMLQAACDAMKKESVLAELYQAITGKEMTVMQVIFKGDMRYPSYVVIVDDRGNTLVNPMTSPYLDDLAIKMPLEMTEAEAEEALAAAGYKDEWKTLTLRAPLYSVVYPPLYIFEVRDKGFIAVDSTDATNVFPIQ